MMKAKEFVERLIKTAKEVSTCYLQGGFGQRLKTSGGDWYNPNYSWNKDHVAEINAHKDTDPLTFGFDCVCMVKGILWGFEADPAKEYGGAVYGSNGVSDSSISKIASQCAGLTTDFSGIVPGELVFLEGYGHVGVYVGDGLVVEATPAWKNGVQLTACANLGSVKGFPSRRWNEHGKCAWIDYETPAPGINWEQAYKDLSEAYGKLEQEATASARELTALRSQNETLAAKVEKLNKEVAEIGVQMLKAQTAALDATERAKQATQDAAEEKKRADAAVACMAKYKAFRGDMNGDGKVNVKDAIYLYKHTIAPDRYPLADIEEIPEGGETT